jgi:integrase
MTLVSQRILEVALERSLRASTVRSYETLLRRIHLLDREVATVTQAEVLEAVWQLESPNTRRSTVIAVKSVVGLDLKIPRGVPRRYVLPDEDTLRIALLCTPHEIRGLLMMYAGLRSGEASAITGRDVQGDRLTVDKQVLEDTGRIGAVKSSVAAITIPWWLSERLQSVEDITRPASVRESLRRAGRKVGISLNPHQLRHWYATHLLAEGASLVTVSRALRHSDIKTTAVYLQIDDGEAIHRILG